MPITHHPDPATLMSYAAGTLGEALSAAVACHVDLCATCRRQARELDVVGGVLLAALSPERAPMAGPPPDAARIEPHRSDRVSPVVPGLPRPLARLIGGPLESVAWKRLAPGLQHARLPLSPGATGELRLLRVAPGKGLPDHGHHGAELTLVLRGAYRDETGRFGPGDIADLDETVEHRPVVEAGEECICLIALEKRMRFKGLAARLLQPFTGM